MKTPAALLDVVLLMFIAIYLSDPGILGFGLMMDVVEPELVKVGCLEGTGLRVAEVDQRVAPVDMKVIITS